MTGGPVTPSYGPADLGVGAALDVFGRTVVLTDCDAYTKEYYRVTFGIDTFTPIKAPGEEERPEFSKRVLPPWNGYGSFEDSAENCRTVLPKQPHPDFVKFINKDKQGFDSYCLRFAARLINDRPEDATRYFVIRYYLSDDTIAISELAARNTGFLGGKFLKRNKVYLPEVEDFFVPVEPPIYRPEDMWVGNEVVINKHRFKLIAADEYAIRYMELHSDEFPKANMGLIMDKIRQELSSQENLFKDFVAKYMEAVLPNKKELMTVRCFKQALKEIMCDKMTEHEFITLIRHFRGDAENDKLPRREMIRSLVFTELTRGIWDDRTRLLEGFRHADEGLTGVLSEHRVKQLLRAHRLPINPILMECMLTVLKKDVNCNIYYDDVIDFLDFKTQPVSKLSETDRDKVVRHALPLKYTEEGGRSFLQRGGIVATVSDFRAFASRQYAWWEGEIYSIRSCESIDQFISVTSFRSVIILEICDQQGGPAEGLPGSGLRPIELRRLRSENLSSIRSRTAETAMIFCDTDSGPYYNGRRCLAALNDCCQWSATMRACKMWGELDEVIEEGYVNWNAFLCELNLEHLVKEDK
ncbi:EF-hand domain-containing family member C2 [Eumeta japonica]|uniref:EF-hand domain-containing family member C2 n=1 Tax=Eumeta variegata TaxID=151549 RepID=A0A4C1ZDE8_EUMVA|nr:EF-hand domain-containing family member C2 [Eumeta japonica]